MTTDKPKVPYISSLRQLVSVGALNVSPVLSCVPTYHTRLAANEHRAEEGLAPALAPDGLSASGAVLRVREPGY